MVKCGGDEFLGGEKFKILFVAPMGHGRAIKDPARVLQLGDPGSGSGTSIALTFKHSQDLGAEDLFRFFQVLFWGGNGRSRLDETARLRQWHGGVDEAGLSLPRPWFFLGGSSF
jgi:hypothetical protein